MRMGIILAMVVALTTTVGIGSVWAEPRVITVAGEGRVSRVPDMATVRVGASHQAKSAQAAMNAVSEALRAMMRKVEQAGIAPQDMQTQGLSLHAVRDQKSIQSGGPQLVGFVASNQLSLRVRDLEGLGAVLAALVGAGANDIGGIGFGLSAPDEAQNNARRAAVADARARAELYAQAAGVTLGQVVSITEGAGGAVPRVEMMRSAKVNAVPIAPGEVTVSAHVQVTWALAD